MGVVPCRILRRSVAAVKLLTRRFAALCVAAAVLLAGCATIPADPDGTLDRVRADGGLTAKSPWADKVALTRPHTTYHLFGQTVWAGWLMIAAMVYTGIGPVILGHLKKPLAEKLHDKVLWADAEMNAADWRTAGAAIIGILGIGVGWWWADAVLTAANGPAWVGSAAVRVRDQGHLLHAEVFVVPSAPVELADLEALVDTIQGLDWKLNDVVVVPVSRLPDAVRATPASG